MGIIGYFVKKGWKLVNIPVLLEAYIWAFSIIYLYFRFIEPSRFLYVPSRFITSIHVTDGFLLLPVGLIFYYILYCIRYFRQTIPDRSSSNGFFTDSPFILNQSNDSLGRVEYIKDLASKILSTNATDHSFAIGIVGQWGAGKTAFLNTLEDQLKTKSDVIQLQFNPWISHNTDNITAIFFSDLASRLSQYDDSLKTEITAYSRELLQSVDNNSFAIFRQLFESSIKEKELQEQYKLINEHIQRLQKKVVVYIDDVDRLDKKEVVEVLRIIRNTADFGNTFFIVAFDKSYVTTCINEALINNSENYLEKIFQIEYYLPLHPDKLVYKKSLLTYLRSYIPETYQKVLDYIEDPSANTANAGFITHFEILPPVNYYMRTFRDVIRFMNIFLLNYDRIQHNIYLPDFIGICLLRLRYPEVYQVIYYNKRVFLSTSEAFSFMESESGELFLNCREKEKRNLENTEIYYYLTEHHKRLALNNNEISDVMNLLHSIFKIPNATGSYPDRRTLRNHHMTITDAAYFDRYFDFSLTGRLDQHEFDEALTLPIEELEKKISEWSKARQITTDLIVKLENLSTPDNKEFFEKVIRAIVYLTNQPHPNDSTKLLSFSFHNFYEKLGGNAGDANEIIQKKYSGNKQEFKTFLKSLYFQNADSGIWGFLNNFAVTMLKEHDDEFIFTHEELEDLIKNSFIAAVTANPQLSLEIMEFYSQGIRLFQKQNTGKDHMVPEGKGVEMTEKLRNALEKNIRVLLEYNIFRRGPGHNYEEDRWHRVIYGSDEAFAKALENQASNPVVKEYREFQNLYRANKQPVEFSFKLLKVS
jgi:hypothetical protein